MRHLELNRLHCIGILNDRFLNIKLISLNITKEKEKRKQKGEDGFLIQPDTPLFFHLARPPSSSFLARPPAILKTPKPEIIHRPRAVSVREREREREKLGDGDRWRRFDRQATGPPWYRGRGEAKWQGRWDQAKPAEPPPVAIVGGRWALLWRLEGRWRASQRSEEKNKQSGSNSGSDPKP